MRADERAVLEPWARAFESVLGAAPLFAPLPGTSSEDDLHQLSVPDVFPQGILGSAQHFAAFPQMCAHVRQLGFDWDERLRVNTLPTPSTFNARLLAHGLPAQGFTVAFSVHEQATMALGSWLTTYLTGAIPIVVLPAARYASALGGPAGGHGHGDLRWHLQALVHDLTIHALNYHLVPHTSITAIRERLHEALPDRVAQWTRPGALAPLTLTFFLDNDFNRYCYEVWFRSERPSDFARVFSAPDNHIQLMDALEVRIAETTRGVGDIASGDADEMPPLQPCEFKLA